MLVKALNASILISLGGGLLLTLLGWFLTPLLLRIMNVPDGVFGFALQYLRIYFLGMVPMMLYNMGAGILRALGDSRRPMIILFYCMILHLCFELCIHPALENGRFRRCDFYRNLAVMSASG